ncbi:hypothetical protein [Kitasatospora purpeofusca]|uniref:hypothetical protein n=1 Tax=Kitasatospora purpeofusca TaxID=67352 RepID=UPI003F4AA4BD
MTWRCRNRAEHGNCPDSGYGNLEHIEARVVDWLRQQADPANPSRGREIAEARAGLVMREVAVQAKLKKLISQEDALADAVASRVIDYQSAQRKKERIDQRRTELNTKLEELKSARAKLRPHPGSAAIAAVLAAWDDATPDRRNLMIKDIVRVITVNKGRGIALENKYEITAVWEPLGHSIEEALSTAGSDRGRSNDGAVDAENRDR